MACPPSACSCSPTATVCSRSSSSRTSTPRRDGPRVYGFLRELDDDPIELTQADILAAARIELNEPAVGTALKILEGAGAIEKFLPRENMAIIRINVEPDETARPQPRRPAHPQAHVQRIVLLGLEGLVNRRYAEPVYFHPDDFAAALGLDRPALTRALRRWRASCRSTMFPPSGATPCG